MHPFEPCKSIYSKERKNFVARYLYLAFILLTFTFLQSSFHTRKKIVLAVKDDSKAFDFSVLSSPSKIEFDWSESMG